VRELWDQANAVSNRVVLRHQCPDCGAKIAVPADVVLGDDMSLSIIPIEDELYDAMVRHVELNPEIHPTFTNEETE